MVTSGITGTENKDNKQCFVSLSKDEVQKLSIKFVPKNTKKNTNWAVKNLTGWRDYHNSNSEDLCQENLLEVANPVLINKWITRSMAETRHEEGSTYPLKTIAYNWHVQSDQLLQINHVRWCITSGAGISNKPRVYRPCCQGNRRQRTIEMCLLTS